MKEGEDRSSSHAVFVPLTTDMGLKRTTDKLIGQDKKKIEDLQDGLLLKENQRQTIFACEDIREKKKRLALQGQTSVLETCVPRESDIKQLKDSVLFFCAATVMKAMNPQQTTTKLNTEKGLLKDVDVKEVIKHD